MNIYTVRSSYPRKGRTGNVHVTDNVIAEDLMDAATHVKKQRPKAHIWTVAHKGSLASDMISDESLPWLLPPEHRDSND